MGTEAEHAGALVRCTGADFDFRGYPESGAQPIRDKESAHQDLPESRYEPPVVVAQSRPFLMAPARTVWKAEAYPFNPFLRSASMRARASRTLGCSSGSASFQRSTNFW